MVVRRYNRTNVSQAAITYRYCVSVKYIKQVELNNTENYRPLPNDPTKINNDTVNETIKRFQKEHLIKDKVA